MTARECTVDYDVKFNQLLNACIHRVNEDPPLENLRSALFWYNKGNKKLKYYNGQKVCMIVDGDDIETCVHRLIASQHAGELLVSSNDRQIDKYQGDEGIIMVDINGVTKTATPGMDYLKVVTLNDLTPEIFSETFDDAENARLATVGSIKTYLQEILDLLGLNNDSNIVAESFDFVDSDWILVGDEYKLIFNDQNFSINAKSANVYDDAFDEIELYTNVQPSQVVIGASYTFSGHVVIFGTVGSAFEDDETIPVTDESCFIFDEPTQTIIGYHEDLGGLEVHIPSQINNIDVLNIGEEAFAYKALKKMIIPEGVTHIYGDAFRNNVFTEIVLPSTLVHMGQGAFRSNSLRSVTIPESLTSIYAHAFSGNEIVNITLPSGLTAIGDHAFQFNRLENINIPSGVSAIGERAFGNNRITYLVLPMSLTEIENYCFENNIITTIHIPSSVTYIGEGAFLNNRLRAVHIPNSVTDVADNAFRDNVIEDLTLSTIMTHINNGVFYNNKINVVTLPNTLLYIGIDAFRSNNLSSITIPANVVEIKKRSFLNNNISTINIGDDVILDISILNEENDNFNDEYIAQGSTSGTYIGTQTGTWTKS